jgi:30S ribosomal protein S31
MGKGDKKSRRGKIFNGSYGKTRPKHKKKIATVVTEEKPKNKKK